MDLKIIFLIGLIFFLMILSITPSSQYKEYNPPYIKQQEPNQIKPLSEAGIKAIPQPLVLE